jgi:hypothetical protein
MLTDSDLEYDIDLFAQDDLYDINIIGSMLKAWLRDLPDELFPKEAQERIARECAGAEKVPQMLIDELSNLSPFNYYLLFAITCHLSLLLAHSDKNKMDFRNLCICFQPCMKIDAFSFKFLVCDWRDCWKGCKHEARFIEEEYMMFDQPPPRGISANRNKQQQQGVVEEPSQGQQQSQQQQQQQQQQTQQVQAQYYQQQQPPPQVSLEDASVRNLSSSESSKPSPSQFAGEQNKGRLKKKTFGSNNALATVQPQPENGSVASNHSTISTTLTIDSSSRETPQRGQGQGSDLRPLSPIKPLSPLGF